MKPFSVCACRLVCLVVLLMVCTVPVSHAQTIWTVDSSWENADGRHDLHSGFHNGDSLHFADYDRLHLYDYRWLKPYPYTISSITTDEVGQGTFKLELLNNDGYYKFDRALVKIDDIGTEDNPLKRLELERCNIDLDITNLYVDELSVTYIRTDETILKIENGTIGKFEAISGDGFYTVSEKCSALLEIGNQLRIGSGSNVARPEHAHWQLNGVESGRYYQHDFTLTGKGSLEKFHDGSLDGGTLTLMSNNTYTGGTIISGGRLIALSESALGFDGGLTLKKDAVLQIGDTYSANRLWIRGGLHGEGGGNLELYVDRQGGVSSLRLQWLVDDFEEATQVRMVGDPASLNLWGATMQNNLYEYVLIEVDGIPGAAPQAKDAFKFKSLETSRYCFDFYYDYDPDFHGNGKWYATSAPQDVIIPDISTMMLTNIIGFEIPRAQNVDGPWAKMKGGQLNDGKSMFNHNSYQTLQIGCDKRLDSLTCDKSYWNAGMFFEGDWMYGRGDYRSSCNGVAGNIYGNLSSSTSGVGAGLYLSRTNHQNIYLDVAGRVNLFDNKANMYAQQMPEANNYRTAWSSKTFSLAMELGKTLSSKNGRYTFNPYNQVIYVRAPSNDFDVIFADNSIVNVHTDNVDAWTNKLGGLVSLNFKNKEDRVNRTIFGSMNYYQGLSGTFSTKMFDTLNPNAEWITTNAGRPKNNLSYATGIVGFSLLPKENIRLTTQSNLLFGDVSGWSVSLTGSIGF